MNSLSRPSHPSRPAFCVGPYPALHHGLLHAKLRNFSSGESGMNVEEYPMKNRPRMRNHPGIGLVPRHAPASGPGGYRLAGVGLTGRGSPPPLSLPHNGILVTPTPPGLRPPPPPPGAGAVMAISGGKPCSGVPPERDHSARPHTPKSLTKVTRCSNLQKTPPVLEFLARFSPAGLPIIVMLPGYRLYPETSRIHVRRVYPFEAITVRFR